MEDSKLVLFLHDEKTRFIVSRIAFLNNDFRKFEFFSDFDVFNILCENLYLLKYHKTRDEFLNVLENMIGRKIETSKLSLPQYRISIWQKIFKCEESFDREINFPHAAIKPSAKNRVFHLDSCIDNNYSDIFELLQSSIDAIKRIDANSIFFDANNIIYSRPDDYRASINYEAIKSEEKDSSMLLLWMLCRILMNTDATLILRCNSIEKIESILSLVFNLRLSPKIILSLNNMNKADCDKVFDLLFKFKEKNISLELSPKESDELVDMLREMPLCFISNVNAKQQLLYNAFNAAGEQEKINIFTFLNLLNTGE